jgi:hypothetical protein
LATRWQERKKTKTKRCRITCRHERKVLSSVARHWSAAVERATDHTCSYERRSTGRYESDKQDRASRINTTDIIRLISTCSLLLIIQRQLNVKGALPISGCNCCYIVRWLRSATWPLTVWQVVTKRRQVTSLKAKTLILSAITNTKRVLFYILKDYDLKHSCCTLTPDTSELILRSRFLLEKLGVA